MSRILKIGSLAIAAASLALAACSDRDSASESAEDYAARIGGQQTGAAEGTSPQAEGTPTAPHTATPLAGAAPGPYERGTQTDPKASTCGAPDAADALGKPYDRVASTLQAALPPGGTLRAVMPGAETGSGNDPKRLNAMLDAGRIVRDLRCG